MNDNNISKKGIRIFLLPMILIALLTALDQFTKYMIQTSFELYESKEVIDGVLSFTYVQNRGMAWGMFQGKIPVFAIFTAVILILAFRVLYNVVDEKRYCFVKYVIIFLISGGLGNLIDRLTLGYVVDFIHATIIDFPVFNVADIYVTVSMFAMMIALFVYKNDDLDKIIKLSFKDKKNNGIETDKEADIVEEGIDE
ncbi:MAG: signal peptidase II [Lachnospiraceae bacterium]|nr:signal peptidase II [Lachnospiraceae bacterium]